MMRKVLRQEKKYLLTMEQFKQIDSKCVELLHADKYNDMDGYKVRTLYFDSLEDMDFEDKIDGLETRKKIRLRIYSPHDEYAALEMKQKQGDNQLKRSFKISREDAQELCKGRYQCLLKYKDPFTDECYAMMNILFYRPKSIVEYQRKAYVTSENETRITFDTQIKATESCLDLFSQELNQYPVIDGYHTIMEVKHSGFLLSYVKDIISLEGKTSTSLSKYSLSRSVSKHFLF